MRIIKKEIGLEELVSRIPSLLPYIDFDIYGNSILYNNTNNITLGILHKATDGEEGSYGHIMGSFTLILWKLKNDDINTISFNSDEYSSLPEDILDIFEEFIPEGSNTFVSSWRPKQVLSATQYNSINRTFDSDNISISIKIRLNNLKGKYEPDESIELYSDPVNYYPITYSNIVEDNEDVISVYDYNDLSLFGRNCYKPILYVYRDKNNLPPGKTLYINVDAYNAISETSCDKYDYIPFLYTNMVLEPQSIDEDDYTTLLDENGTVIVDPLIYLDEKKEYGWVEVTGGYREVVNVDIFRNKTRTSKINYKIKECSNGEHTIDFNTVEGLDTVTINGIKYKILCFMTQREDNSYVLGYENDNIRYEFYCLSVRKQIISPYETYSYREMMDIYYANRNRKVWSDYSNLIIDTIKEIDPNTGKTIWSNIYDPQRFVNVNDKNEIISFVDYHILMPEKQPFIAFIDNAIGKCYVSECVEEYNLNNNDNIRFNISYKLPDDIELTYAEINDSSFENIDKLFRCTQYIKVHENNIDNAYEPYMYVNKDRNDVVITKESFETLPLYGTGSYNAVEYALEMQDEEDDSLLTINEEVYSKLSFYGQSAYVPYQYFNGDIITVEEYKAKEEEDKLKYRPYTYVNKNNSSDIISKDVYDRAYLKSSKSNLYSVYQYINTDYVIISYNDFINIYDSDDTTWKVYTYVNKTKSKDIITVKEYSELTKYGSLDYTAIKFANSIDETQPEINEDDFYRLGYDGQSDYDVVGYINTNNTDDIISAEQWQRLSQRSNYMPYIYTPKDEIKTIDEFQYNALPKYGMKDYIENEYYASIDISTGTDEAMYETFIISAEQYNDDTYWESADAVGEKYQYTVYNYKPNEDVIEEGDSADYYIVAFEDFDDLSYLGQVDYTLEEHESVEDRIDLNRELYISKKDGEIISDSEYEALGDVEQEQYEKASDAQKCVVSLIPDVIYLSQVNNLLYQMKNMKRNHELLVAKKLPKETGVNCDYSKYLRMGGDDMVKLLEWLTKKADEEATNLMQYGILDNYITMPLTLNLTLQDSGYYTPAMNYKTRGMKIAPGERFTYVDESGNAETYINQKPTEQVLNPNNMSNFTLMRDLAIDDLIYEQDTTEVTLSGSIDSKLRTLRMTKTYTNYMDQPDVPLEGEDWLFYYRKGNITDVSSITDENGDIMLIDEGVKSADALLLYGNFLENIEADNDTCTIKFTYYLNAHLKLVGVGEQHTHSSIVTKEEYEDRYKNMRSRFWLREDDSSNVIISDTKPSGNYKNLFICELVGYSKDKDGHDTASLNEVDDNNIDSYPYRMIEIKYYDKNYDIDKDSAYGKHHGVKHTDTYYYEQYGELYDLVQNGGFDTYINSTQRGIEKYAFISTPNNSMRKMVNNHEIIVSYVGADFEFTFDQIENGNNNLYNAVYKEDLLNGIHYKPIINDDVFVIRGTNAAFERHLRLGEVKTIEDFENYHNGSFFNIRNNF